MCVCAWNDDGLTCDYARRTSTIQPAVEAQEKLNHHRPSIVKENSVYFVDRITQFALSISHLLVYSWIQIETFRCLLVFRLSCNKLFLVFIGIIIFFLHSQCQWTVCDVRSLKFIGENLLIKHYGTVGALLWRKKLWIICMRGAVLLLH